MTLRLAATLGLALACALTSADTRAGLQGQMDDMFGSMSNVTNPGAHMGMRRGVITGGGISTRNRVVDVNLINIQKPRFKGGCGGIDGYLGAFSWARGAELQDLWRAVASNAQSFAFKIATSAVTPLIDRAFTELGIDIKSWNQFNLNSCELAQSLFPENAEQRSADWGSRMANQMFGTNSDVASFTDRRERRSAEGELSDTRPQDAAGEINVNYVWRAFKTAQASNWYTGGDRAFLEELMSVTGTVITCVPGKLGCGIGTSGQTFVNGEVQTTVRPPGIRLFDLVDGTYRPVGLAAPRLRIFRCNDDNCLSIREDDNPNLKGFAQRLREVLLGRDNRRGQGVVGQFAAAQGRPTAEQERYVSALGNFGGEIFNLSKKNEAVARQFVDQYVRVIAVEFVYQMLRQMIDSVDVALASSSQDAAGQVHMLIDGVRAQLELDRRSIADDTTNFNNQVQSYVTMMAAVRGDYRDVADFGSVVQ